MFHWHVTIAYGGSAENNSQSYVYSMYYPLHVIYPIFAHATVFYNSILYIIK